MSHFPDVTLIELHDPLIPSLAASFECLSINRRNNVLNMVPLVCPRLRSKDAGKTLGNKETMEMSETSLAGDWIDWKS